MTPKQTGTEVAFGRAVCRGAGVDLAHRLLTWSAACPTCSGR